MKQIEFFSIFLFLDFFLHFSCQTSGQSPAMITEHPLDTTAQAGFFIFLICKAQGNPKPTVQFKINGKVQSNDSHRKIIRSFDFGASLRQQVQMDNNNDVVQCIAENHLGVDTKSATITVIDSNAEVPAGFPIITSGPIDVLSQFGKIAKIRCEVSADPSAKVTWIKNSHEKVDSNNERFQVVGTGSLTIKNVRETDGGSYECMATNKVGTVISQSGMLQIRRNLTSALHYMKEKESPMTPQIVDFKSKIEVSTGQGANLTCNAEGSPIPLVHWEVQIGNPNSPNPENRPLGDEQPSSSTIHLTDITESGSYVCHAKNKMGLIKKEAQIIVKKKPMAPTLVSYSKVEATSAVIEWLPVKSNPPIDSYTLLIKDTSNKDPHLGLRQIANLYFPPQKLSSESKKVSFQITELKAYTNYEVQVVAVSNNIGNSDPSLPIRFQTLELPPSSPPTDLFAKAISPDSIKVTWKPPLQQNGRIKGYRLYYTERLWSAIDNWHIREVQDTPYYLNNLIHNATYYVKVNAYNLAGDGPVSDAFPILVVVGGDFVKTLPMPPVPQNLRGASLSTTSIQIMWTHPAMVDDHKLEGYELKYRLDGDEKGKMFKEHIEPYQTQYLIDNLKPGKAYHISLAGKTKFGVGVSAQLTETTKDENILNEISNLKIWGTNISKDSATICWKMNLDESKIALTHRISYMLIFDISELKSTSENATNLITDTQCCCHVLTHLRPDSGYDLWVKPIPNTDDNNLNIVLKDLTSSKLFISTVDNDSVPDKPEAVSIKVINSTSSKISWKGPVKTLDQVKYYIIEWRELSNKSKNSKVFNVTVDINKSNPNNVYEHILNNLLPNKYYKIEVLAASRKGKGSPEKFEIIKTHGNFKVPSMPRELRMTQSVKIPSFKGPKRLAVYLAWNPPQISHGLILGYRVAISLIGPPEIVKELKPVKIYRNVSTETYKSDEEAKIGPGKTYLFEVQALNSVNFGETARINYTIPEERPSAPPNKLEIQGEKKTVTLKWHPPPIDYRNGIITKYKIQYFDMKEPVLTLKETETESKTTERITNLQENTNYVFKIRAVNKEGDGPWSPGTPYYISSEFFPAPENIETKALNDYQIKVSWNFPEKANQVTDLLSQVNGFHVQVSTNRDFPDGKITFKKIVGPFTSTVMEKIYPNHYFIRVQAIIRDKRIAEWSNIHTLTVFKSKYTERNIKGLNCIGQTNSIKVTWEKPDDYTEIKSFLIELSGYRKFRNIYGAYKIEKIKARTSRIEFFGEEQSTYNYSIPNLEPNTNYDLSIKILYSSISKLESISKTTSCVTLMEQPKSILSPMPVPLRKVSNEIILRLSRTNEILGMISHYYLIVSPIKETHVTPHDVNIDETFTQTKNLKAMNSRYVAAQFTPALFRSKSYVDFVLGSNSPIESFHSNDWIFLKRLPVKKKTNLKAFLRACVIPEGLTSDLKSIPVERCTSSEWSMTFSTDINREIQVFTAAVIAGIGSIVLLVFICIGFACFLKRSHSKISRPLGSTDPCLKQPLMMQPGLSGGNLPQYTNIVNIGNSSRHGYTDSLRTNSDLCATSGVMTPINNHQPLSVSNPMFEQRSLELKKISNTQAPDLVQNALSISNSVRPPIPVHRLESQINELRANDNFLFSQEYESIDPGQQFTWENSNLEINRAKNRYANVIAYDHSRILLQYINGVLGSDYINANYIDGYKRPNAYIATQGPLSNTFGDFWRMVWEQGTASIVMMTKLEERTRIKCDQYWPNKGTESYADGAITVTITDTKELAYYTIRTFIISANYSSNSSEFCSNKDKREIRQYQFTAWPDHGVPDNPMPLLMFLKRIRAGNPLSSRPIIVHCSAGVGRTGAFIVIDTTLERIRHEMTVDIFGQVSIMRAQRNYMVQTEDQYVFVHEVVLDAVRASNTEVSLQNISTHVQKLMRADCTTGTQRATGIELEFQKLSQFKPNNARCTSANLPVNRLKNRLVNILPYEFNRICLQPIRGCEGSDYINASYIDGYQNVKAYIATQAPLMETIEDFWRMIWEHNSTIIVMLTKLREMGREKCHRYWPTERSSRFQYFVVDPMVEYNMPNFVLQEFKVTDARDGQSRTVRQFQFTEWPEQGVPYQATEAFIEFIGQVHKTKEQFGQEGPITVHCSAGVGRTGVFLALSIALERLKNEGVLDLFQVVRALRYQRANMVQSEEQYRFCYLAAQDYVNSFDSFFE